MAGEQSQFEGLLQNLLSTDNKIRVEAEVTVLWVTYNMTVVCRYVAFVFLLLGSVCVHMSCLLHVAFLYGNIERNRFVKPVSVSSKNRFQIRLTDRLRSVHYAVLAVNSTQRASMDAGVKTPQCPHLSSHFCISNTTINLIRVLIYRRFRSGGP